MPSGQQRPPADGGSAEAPSPVEPEPAYGPESIETITTTDLERASMRFSESPDDNELLGKLRVQREQNRGTDISLVAQGVTFKAHRSVLSASSSFFESILKNNRLREEITIALPYGECFDVMLDYMYSGEITIDARTVEPLLKLASHFNIYKLRCYCEEYLDRFTRLENCLRVRFLAELYDLSRAAEACLNFIHDHLAEVLCQSSFLELPFKGLESFLTDPEIGCDVVSLGLLLRALTNWANRDLDGRSIDYQKLLMIINWPDYEADEILAYVRDEPLFKENQLCLYFILNTLEINGIQFAEYADQYELLKRLYECDEQREESGDGRQTPETNGAGEQLSRLAVGEDDADQEQCERSFQKRPAGRHLASKEKSAQSQVLVESPTERRCGRRQIKKRYASEDWVCDERPKRKKTLSMTCTGTEPAPEDALGEVSGSLPATDNEPESTNGRAKVGRTRTKVRSISLRDEKRSEVEAVEAESREEPLDDDDDDPSVSANDYDEMSQEDEESGEEQGELPEMKTDYCVRGKRHSATLAQWRDGVKCPSCCYVGHSAIRLEQHMARVHQEDITYSCKMCAFTCKWNREFYKHMKGHFEGPPYKCEECDYTCDRIQFILSHQMRHTDEKPFFCDKCPFRSRTRGNLIVHFRVHTGEKPYLCQYCDKRFAMKNTLDQHMATHREDRPFLCDACGFTTKYQSHLLSHKRIHTGNVYYCTHDGCNYFSPRKSQLGAHMRSHMSVRSHICPTCGRAFIERSHLIRHERIHLEEKPFKCDQCDYGSTRRDKLKEHLLKHHTEEPVEKVFRPRRRKFEAKLVSPPIQLATDQASIELSKELLHFQQHLPQSVSIAIGDEVYESQIVVTPVNGGKGATIQAANGQEIQLANVTEQDLATTNLIYEYSNGELHLSNGRLVIPSTVEFVDGQETVIVDEKNLQAHPDEQQLEEQEPLEEQLDDGQQLHQVGVIEQIIHPE